MYSVEIRKFLPGYFAHNVCRTSANMLVRVLRFLWVLRTRALQRLPPPVPRQLISRAFPLERLFFFLFVLIRTPRVADTRHSWEFFHASTSSCEQLKRIAMYQGCQMGCFHTKNPNLGKFWTAFEW
jgi:hypothetical protein